MDNSNGSNNIIGEGSVLKGNLNTSGNVRLEGKVIGDLSSSSKVACGETSVVDGNVIAENAEIAGKVTGKVTVSELLILKSTASIHGDISPWIDAVDFNIKSSETVTFPVTFPAISAFSAITLPSTTDVSPQATFEEEERSPITLPSNLTFPEVFKFPFNTLPSPIMLFDPLELSTIGMFS